jgi:hypothetical protein
MKQKLTYYRPGTLIVQGFFCGNIRPLFFFHTTAMGKELATAG